MSLAPAHAGHWYQSLLYAAPLILLLVWVLADRMRARHRRRRRHPPQ